MSKKLNELVLALKNDPKVKEEFAKCETLEESYNKFKHMLGNCSYEEYEKFFEGLFTGLQGIPFEDLDSVAGGVSLKTVVTPLAVAAAMIGTGAAMSFADEPPVVLESSQSDSETDNSESSQSDSECNIIILSPRHNNNNNHIIDESLIPPPSKRAPTEENNNNAPEQDRIMEKLSRTDRQGWSPIAQLALDNNVDELKKILDVLNEENRKRIVNNSGPFILNPLVIATRLGHVEVAELLIACGVNVNDLKEEDGSSLLHTAAVWGALEVAKLLINHGANVDAINDMAETPLHIAASHGYVEVAKLLIKKGANVNAQNKDGNTPLHFAAKKWRTRIADLLIKKGANVNAQNKDGNTPLHFAAKKWHTRTPDLLIKKGAYVNAQNKDGNTPLHVAAEAGLTGVAELLINHDADINAKSNDGTPLELADRNGHQGIVTLINSFNTVDNFINDNHRDFDIKDLRDKSCPICTEKFEEIFSELFESQEITAEEKKAKIFKFNGCSGDCKVFLCKNCARKFIANRLAQRYAQEDKPLPPFRCPACGADQPKPY